MYNIIWFLQGLMAFVFIFSGINKAYFDEQTLVRKGQTGVEGLPSWLIKFIGIAEILGAIGLLAPMLLGQNVIFTPIAAIGLGLIMIPAAFIHYQRNEVQTVGINLFILVICGIIAFYRF